MLTEKEFNLWCIGNRISNTTKLLIQNIRNSPPSRCVGGGKYNVSGKYPSRKMGLTIQFESHKVELASIYQKEHDSDILEYYDQPSPIKLIYPSKDNKNIGVMSTPDFFVICDKSAYWEEWKTEEELVELSKRSPNRYVKDQNGTWRCPPGEEYAAKYELQYKLKSSSEIDWIFQRNIIFLEDYLMDESTSISETIEREIISLIDKRPGVFLSDLINDISNTSVDDIYLMIARDMIYVDIYKNCIAEPDTVKVYKDLEHARAYENFIASKYDSRIEACALSIEIGQKLLWDGVQWTIINVGEFEISLVSDAKNHIELAHEVFEVYINNGKIKGIEHNNDNKMLDSYKEIILGARKEDLEEANTDTI